MTEVIVLGHFHQQHGQGFPVLMVKVVQRRGQSGAAPTDVGAGENDHGGWFGLTTETGLL